MSESDYFESKVEITELNGEIISRKITLTPKADTMKGLRASFEVIIKLLGLGSVVIAAFAYINVLGQQTKQQLQQHASDSITTVRYSEEQRRLQIEIALQQNEMANKQLNFQKEMDFRRQSLEQTFAQTFDQMTLQKKFDIEKERRDFYASTLSSISIDMEALLHLPPNNTSYQSTKQDLFFQLYPKLGIVGDTNAIRYFNDFRYYLEFYEILYPISLTMSEIESLLADSKNPIFSYDYLAPLEIQSSDTTLLLDDAERLNTLGTSISSETKSIEAYRDMFGGNLVNILDNQINAMLRVEKSCQDISNRCYSLVFELGRIDNPKYVEEDVGGINAQKLDLFDLSATNRQLTEYSLNQLKLSKFKFDQIMNSKVRF